MIKYYDKLSISLSEINYEPTLLLFSLEGCNLKCYNCLNYDILVKFKQTKYKTIDEICYYIKRNDFLFESIVLSGGEYLISPLDTIINDIQKIKTITDKKIIIYTNGSFPEKMIALYDLVDGFHTDMKLPYHLLDINEDKELIQLILGTNINQTTLNKLIQSIELTVKLDKGNNQIRSVEYPFLDISAFEANKEYINKLNKKHGKNVPYYINNFINVERE